MMPEWIIKILEGMGIAGAIIFVLLSTVTGLVLYLKQMQAKADKVYGYRLAERDTLNKVLTDTASVIAGIIKANEARNDLTEEQALLIREQAHAFEILKTMVHAQYDNIKDHNSAMAMTIGAMAEAIRVLNSLILENRTIATAHVLDVKGIIAAAETGIKSAISSASQAQLVEMRSLLGTVTTVHRKRRITK
jgi:hypothetical protein